MKKIWHALTGETPEPKQTRPGSKGSSPEKLVGIPLEPQWIQNPEDLRQGKELIGVPLGYAPMVFHPSSAPPFYMRSDSRDSYEYQRHQFDRFGMEPHRGIGGMFSGREQSGSPIEGHGLRQHQQGPFSDHDLSTAFQSLGVERGEGSLGKKPGSSMVQVDWTDEGSFNIKIPVGSHVNPDDINVEIKGKNLFVSIKGTGEGIKQEGIEHQELNTKDITLPDNVDLKKVKVVWKPQGYLHIEAPVHGQPNKQQIQELKEEVRIHDVKSDVHQGKDTGLPKAQEIKHEIETESKKWQHGKSNVEEQVKKFDKGKPQVEAAGKKAPMAKPEGQEEVKKTHQVKHEEKQGKPQIFGQVKHEEKQGKPQIFGQVKHEEKQGKPQIFGQVKHEEKHGKPKGHEEVKHEEKHEKPKVQEELKHKQEALHEAKQSLPKPGDLKHSHWEQFSHWQQQSQPQEQQHKEGTKEQETKHKPLPSVKEVNVSRQGQGPAETRQGRPKGTEETREVEQIHRETHQLAPKLFDTMKQAEHQRLQQLKDEQRRQEELKKQQDQRESAKVEYEKRHEKLQVEQRQKQEEIEKEKQHEQELQQEQQKRLANVNQGRQRLEKLLNEQKRLQEEIEKEQKMQQELGKERDQHTEQLQKEKDRSRMLMEEQEKLHERITIEEDRQAELEKAQRELQEEINRNERLRREHLKAEEERRKQAEAEAQRIREQNAQQEKEKMKRNQEEEERQRQKHLEEERKLREQNLTEEEKKRLADLQKEQHQLQEHMKKEEQRHEQIKKSQEQLLKETLEPPRKISMERDVSKFSTTSAFPDQGQNAQTKRKTETKETVTEKEGEKGKIAKPGSGKETKMREDPKTGEYTKAALDVTKGGMVKEKGKGAQSPSAV